MKVIACRLLYRQIGRLGTSENAINVVRRAEQLLSDRAAALAGARAGLADPVVAGLREPPDVPLSDVEAAVAGAEADLQTAARHFHHAEQRHAALRSLAERLDTALAAWAPARDEFVLAESMSKLVRGMGAYRLPHCLRITIGTEEETRATASALAEFTTA